MKRTRKWHKKLTIKEIKHVNDFCRGTMKGVKAALAEQARFIEAHPGAIEPCQCCRTIAAKLWGEENQ